MFSVTSFEFAFDKRYRWPLRLLGVSESSALVTVGHEELRIRFGPWRMRTPLDNVADTKITRDYSAAKAIGVRASFADSGVTFGTNTDEGLCICFHDRVPGMLPGNLVRHEAATVTVDDCAGLQDLLS